MKKFLVKVALILGFAVSAFAQDPKYFVGAGMGFNNYDKPQSTGFMTFAVNVAPGQYTTTTMELTGKTSSVRAGYERVLAKSGNVTLLAKGDAGVTTSAGNVGGSYSGGGTLLYDCSKWTKTPGTYFIGSVSATKSSLENVKPTFYFGFGKSF